MLERINDLPQNIVGIEAVGTVSRDDYEKVFVPLLEQCSSENKKIDLLYWFGPRFDSFTAGAVWDDFRIGTKYIRLFNRCALVTDINWIKHSTNFIRPFLPCSVRVYGNKDYQLALQWLATPPAKGNLGVDLDSQTGVLVIEPEGSLRREDFEKVSATVDPWLAEHGKLSGLIVHARRFPGWESLGALVRHIQFVGEHHKKIRRVALVSDSKVLNVARKVADHFVAAEVRQFGYHELEDAKNWVTETNRAEESQHTSV